MGLVEKERTRAWRPPSNQMQLRSGAGPRLHHLSHGDSRQRHGSVATLADCVPRCIDVVRCRTGDSSVRYRRVCREKNQLVEEWPINLRGHLLLNAVSRRANPNRVTILKK